MHADIDMLTAEESEIEGIPRLKNRYVLVEGLHRLEALKALGEATIDTLIVMPRRG